MGIIAWIVLGLGAGRRQHADPGRRSPGPDPDLRDRHRRGAGGGWAATACSTSTPCNGFFNLSTWLTAIAGSAVLLLIFHLISARSGSSRRFAHR